MLPSSREDTNVNNNQLNMLIKMVNQISSNSPVRGDDEKVRFVAQHLKKYWARSMKQQIVAYADVGGDGLTSTSLAAIRLLCEDQEKDASPL